MIRVLGAEIHYRIGEKVRTSAVDWWRVINPLSNLPTDKFYYETRKNPFILGDKNWQDVLRQFDIVHTSYVDNPMGYITLRVLGNRMGKKVILDLDDNIWEIHETNPVHDSYLDPKKGFDGMSKIDVCSTIMRDAEYVTCTNEYLKQKIVKFTKSDRDKIYVLPNRIDPKVYKHRVIPNLRNPDYFYIGYQGSWTHYNDLTNDAFQRALVRIMKEYRFVKVVTCGMYMPSWAKMMGERYIYLEGSADFYQWAKVIWPKYINSIDMAVAPLANTDFNKSKSEIKYLENAMGHIPVIASSIRQYKEVIKHGETGLLAETEEQWYQMMKFMIYDKDFRLKIGENGYKSVMDNYTIDKIIPKYVELYEKTLTSR